MELSKLCTLLVLHKDTLKTLDIGCISPLGRRHLFDLSDFRALEELTLSRDLMAANLGSSVSDANALLAPNLKTFGWSFTICHRGCESSCNFGDGEETWLRGFLETAIARQSTLTRIKITYLPYLWKPNLQDDYPWDRMDAIRDDFRSFGLVIHYNSPTYTREEWRERRPISWYHDAGDSESIEYESERTESASTNQEPTGSESTDSKSGDSDFADEELKDLEPGRDIREFFSPLPTP